MKQNVVESGGMLMHKLISVTNELCSTKSLDPRQYFFIKETNTKAIIYYESYCYYCYYYCRLMFNRLIVWRSLQIGPSCP